MSTLILTNGDSAVSLLKDAGVEATIIPWRDMLHSGPVPHTDTEDELIRIRAHHLADGEVNTEQETLEGLQERNSYLDNNEQYEKIELWFEHDLYDQLQLVEIIAMLAKRVRLQNVTLVQALTYLGMQTPDTILKFKELAINVEPIMFERATRIWDAFRDEAPEALFEETQETTPGFPVLRQCIKRGLQELPGPDGLSRTERHTLYSINRGVARTGMLFARVNNMEEAAFLGDWGFFSILSDLQCCDKPLVTGLSEAFTPRLLQDDMRRKAFITSELQLTDLGRSVLEGVQDHSEHNKIDRWLGGTHITNDNLWRWNDEEEVLISPA
ncbi:MAG: DUF1835 domain-containing protein [Methyloligellaceae bacterium]